MPNSEYSQPSNEHSDNEVVEDGEDIDDEAEAPAQRGAKSPLTQAQRRYVREDYVPVWLSLNKTRAGDRKFLLDWKNEAIDKILKSRLFVGKLDKSRSRKQWRAVRVSLCSHIVAF